MNKATAGMRLTISRITSIIVLVIALQLMGVFGSTAFAGKATWAPGGTITSVSTGDDTTCAIAGGKAYCWGINTTGQIGDGTTSNSSYPVPVDTTTGLSGKTVTYIDFVTVDYNTDGHVCAVASSLGYCWGANNNGRLGNGNAVNQSSPSAVFTGGVLSGKNITSVSTGVNYSCAAASGKAYCWGYDGSGGLGNGSGSGSSFYPGAVDTTTGMSGVVSQVVGVGSASCARTDSGSVYCWGNDGNGRLGNGGSNTDMESPVAVDTSGALSGKTATQLSGGATHVCVIASSNIYCWGQNASGQIGDATQIDRSTPAATVATAFSSKTITQVSAGRFISCALASGEMYCWGYNVGNYGNGNTSDKREPERAANTGELAGKSISLISNHPNQTNCGVSDNQLYCWGRGEFGKLGNGSTADITTPDYVRQIYDFKNNGYRFYENADSATPGAPLAATNTVADIATNGQAFRVRTDLGSTSGGVVPSDNTYKLQVATKSAGTCSAQTTGFSDVTTSTVVAYNTNAGVSSGASITTNGNDPVSTSSSVAQKYISGTGTFTEAQYVDANKSGMWDFSLRNNGMTVGQSYCLRLVYGNGTALESAAVFPEVRRAVQELTLGIVNSSGAAVASPSYGLSNTVVQTACQNTTGTFGTSSQRVRVSNTIPGTGWGVSIAATGGSTSTWQAGGNRYDFNDPSGSPAGCNSGSDGDGYAGQLRFNPSIQTVTPQSGCSMTGLSNGVSSGFVQSSVDAISILSATNAAATGCYWDVTGIAMQQQIPANQPSGNYDIGMTLTVVSQ